MRNPRADEGATGRSRSTRRRLAIEGLEDRLCPTVDTVFLDFETPLSGSVPELTTGFGSVNLTGYYESVIIDSDLVANGMGGRVFANVPTSQDTGYGSIELVGGLGKAIRFYYGTRNEVTSPAVQGGFTGYTYSRSL